HLLLRAESRPRREDRHQGFHGLPADSAAGSRSGPRVGAKHGVVMQRRDFVAAALSTPPLARDLARLLRPPAPGDAVRIASPNGAIELQLLPALGAGVTYGVTFRSRPVIASSSLGILVDGVDLGQGVEAGKVESYRANERYACRGVHSQATNRFNEIGRA